MERKNIYLCLAHMSEEGLEQKYIKEAFDTNWVVPLGPNVNAFEEDLKQFVNSQENGSENPNREIVALSAGTAAIHLALIACGVQAGDEVLCQSFTFCASANPVTYVGATPVFIDSEKDSWNMDTALLEQAIIDRKAKTGKYPKAIIPVALYGMPYRIEEIMRIANNYGIPVIEDAAEGMGSRWKGRVLGTFGDYGILSFNGNKMITTSGGGALICKDTEAKNKVMWLATQAREAYPYYQHETIGFNYRLSNICAGIGRGQMTILNQHLAHHKHVQARYAELLKNIPGIHLHEAPYADFEANYWLCTITIDPDVRIKGQENAYKETIKSAVGGAAGVIHQVDSPTTDCQPNKNVEALRIFMLEHHIEARPVWKPMHKQPVFKNAPAYTNGVSEAIFKVGMCLPAGPMVTDEDLEYIVNTIKEAIIR
ncbi:MAG: aminotransferase class I/II-fold pyridoxal phosphate-dependent enzyme [Paludibacteraceae bacterium]|nr:aminotransferase class I/II-fold pyridoxal phosphate-dependent enzyme [Paludibacteraceae bacterium]MBQ9296483.1 aminotransferase class I/II-fold pyridoxal phosphate-dependent enzyme [Paludibacteraceae bacterium]